MLRWVSPFTLGEGGTFNVANRTLPLYVKARFVPNRSWNEKAAALGVFAGFIEIGAAWKRYAKDNTVYQLGEARRPSIPAHLTTSRPPASGGGKFHTGTI
jgi:uncharacterized protein (DUF736 family)